MDKPFNSYSILINCNSSILNLNKNLKIYGYEVIEITLDNLYKDFSLLWDHKKLDSSEIELIAYKDNEGDTKEICSHFLKKYKSRRTGVVVPSGMQDADYDTYYPSYFLKKIESCDGGFLSFTDIFDFSNDLISGLRLLNAGNILYGISFLKSADEIHKFGELEIYKHLGMMMRTTGETYELSSSDLENFNQIFKLIQGDLNENLSMSLHYFNYTYKIHHAKVDQMKKVFFIMILEQLLTINNDKVGHTISRNASLLLGGDKDKLNENYAIIKKFYGLRSDVIHGNDSVEYRKKIKTLRNEYNVIIPDMRIEGIVRKILKVILLEKQYSPNDLYLELCSKSHPRDDSLLYQNRLCCIKKIFNKYLFIN